ncbi:MAG: N-acetylmuramoyl-L-alanine amidase [Alphaproteobacteria bacterium]
MVHSQPRLWGRGIIIALALTFAHAPLQAQTRVSPTSTQEQARLQERTGSKLQGNKLRTRFVVGLPKRAEYEVFSLNNPNRVIVELGATRLRLPAHPKGKAVGLIKGFRAGLSAKDRSRIVIDVTEPVVVANAKMEKVEGGKGQILAIEIVRVAKSVRKKPFPKPTYSLGAMGLQPPLPRPAVHPDVRAEKAFKPIIVIDPGHGGHDTGAKKNGAVEKQITLAFGKLLAEKLKATGRYKVLMTRDTDIFVPLGDRVAYGESNKANLFISVHCDYANRGGANGATIYSLRESVAKRLRRSAKGKTSKTVLSTAESETVKKASGDVDLVKGILADLARREVEATRDRTSVLARSVIAMMGASTKMRSDPDKQASFRVLKTAQFPSILIELAYVTNKKDAQNLQSKSWRDKVSASILTAVDGYFSNRLAQLPM